MISKRAETYGKSFFDVEASEQVLESLKVFSQVLSEEDIFEFFDSFVISLKDKKESLQKILGDESKNLKNFIFLLLDRRLILLLPEIVQTYEILLDEKHSRVRGVIYSCGKISSKEKEEAEEAIEKVLNKKVDLSSRQDTNLMGGFYVKVGNYIFNDTIKCHLKKFQSSGGK